MIVAFVALLVASPGVSYDARGACPDEAAFRVDLTDALGPDGETTDVDLHVSADGSGTVAVVVVEDVATGAARTFTGPTADCAELVARAATAVAVLVGPPMLRPTPTPSAVEAPRAPPVLTAPEPSSAQTTEPTPSYLPVLGVAVGVDDGAAPSLAAGARLHVAEPLPRPSFTDGVIDALPLVIELGARAPSSTTPVLGASVQAWDVDALAALCGAGDTWFVCAAGTGALWSIASTGLIHARNGLLPSLDAGVRAGLQTHFGPGLVFLALDAEAALVVPQVGARSSHEVLWQGAPGFVGVTLGAGVDLASW